MSDDTANPVDFGKMLREAREREGLTVTDASKRLGVSYTHWFEVESGARPPFRMHHREGLSRILPSLPSVALDQMNDRSKHGGTRVPGPGKRIGRPPVPNKRRRKRRQVYLHDEEIEIVVALLREHAGAVGETGEQVLTYALRRLVAGDWLPRRVEEEETIMSNIIENIRNSRPISKAQVVSALQRSQQTVGAYFRVPLADNTLRRVPAWLKDGNLVYSHPTEPGYIAAPEGATYFFEDGPARHRILGLGTHRTELDDVTLQKLYQTAEDEDERRALWEEMQSRRARAEW